MINKTARSRVHYLDNLRAYIMWLGVVIHVAMLQMASDTPQKLREPALSEWADMLVFSIHSFRMPLFFILSGFFMAAILGRKGVVETIRLRLLRIGVPLLIFGPIISYLLGFIQIEYLQLMQSHGVAIDESWITKAKDYPFNLGHLWFLYYLLLCHLILIPLFYWSPLPNSGVFKKLRYWVSHPAMLIIYAALIAYIDSHFERGMIPAEGALMPNTLQLLHYVPYFYFGLMVYKFRRIWLNHFQRCWGRYTLLGCFMMLTTLVLIEPLLYQQGSQVDNFIVAYCYGLWGWLWSFALFGFFKRWVFGYQPWLRYLADSAYWVYIIHLPIVLLVSYFLYDVDWPIYSKMMVNIFVTSILSLLSYHAFVRYTALGKLLNGKRKKSNWLKNRGTLKLDQA
ncbi:Glucans biosynthesis protein C [Pseudoalteromonas holothuriae]|uniref:Glucans biosynthesis protein C n=1 Tax=Pseudoalteromonas holothuriae TaxID=2963714 RepID=A0A9W4QRH7_9GAMM|nr:MULTISPECIES: acyltransferase family protein [unclassified Pseudoalteromonas]CAH9049685.1 Glucans biosynthesis protein C [Pseudoalteromonas sp. CIP111854]CAH9051645.1 Glucans biosynthesis protein C [Pseudoalteromonas sp. CIP111951]